MAPYALDLSYSGPVSRIAVPAVMTSSTISLEGRGKEIRGKETFNVNQGFSKPGGVRVEAVASMGKRDVKALESRAFQN